MTCEYLCDQRANLTSEQIAMCTGERLVQSGAIIGERVTRYACGTTPLAPDETLVTIAAPQVPVVSEAV